MTKTPTGLYLTRSPLIQGEWNLLMLSVIPLLACVFGMAVDAVAGPVLAWCAGISAFLGFAYLTARWMVENPKGVWLTYHADEWACG